MRTGGSTTAILDVQRQVAGRTLRALALDW